MNDQQKTTGGGGILTAQSRGDYHSYFTTAGPAIQPHYDHLLAQAEQKMNRAEVVGDDRRWVEHFQIWLALLARRYGGER